MFKGLDKDGAETYDTKENAIERAKMMIEWQGDSTDKIMVHRHGVPLWLAHLVRETRLEWIGYEELVYVKRT